MSEKRNSRRLGLLACAAFAFVASCGIPDSFAPGPPQVPLAPVPEVPPQAPPQVVSRLTLSGGTNRVWVGLKVRLLLEAYTAQGRKMSSHQAVVTSSNASVAEVSGLDVINILDQQTRTTNYTLFPQISMLAPGTAVIRASLQGVTDSVVIQVQALPSPSSALVVDTFTVVEYLVPGSGYLGYAPLLRLREPTDGSFADVIAIEFNIPTRTTGWCTGEIRFANGLSAHVNGIDPYPWANDLVFFQLNGIPLPDGPATARVIVRDATGTWGMIEATARIERSVTNPDFPLEPIGAWNCPLQATTP